jgi:hypothetical protein
MANTPASFSYLKAYGPPIATSFSPVPSEHSKLFYFSLKKELHNLIFIINSSFIKDLALDEVESITLPFKFSNKALNIVKLSILL